jgi:hypothetical protein
LNQNSIFETLKQLQLSYQLSRETLTKRCTKATPNEWARYMTSSMAIKVIRDGGPQRLCGLLKKTYYSHRSSVAQGLFLDSTNSEIGKQGLQNRLHHMAKIKEPWN